ncbi:LacI family DNA-binding transcriptional regulator [Mycetocola reblochoni]|uniref:LacI family DNA-binding transcriptional regulator n=1 Tax=Mycetocola reblochoni TaxID=331618 RepID=A0A3L6ZRT2_9MICO|nr:LacI family DNA-binding transcriptional regulator [Mycetocola reblochoni]RLP70558.1 LacI family DNA-binding transcriptional regulator [Mycetocola reblochoni]
MAPTRVTMARLASRLDVSVSTVSNAYNRPEKLSAELRERVLGLAAELGYAGPDPAARSLRRRRTGGIGVVFTDELPFVFTDPASAGFLAGVAETLAVSGQHLVLLPAGSPDHRRPAPVDSAAVDGVIFHSLPRGEATLALLRRRGAPAVLVDQPPDAEGLSWVGLDEEDAMRGIGELLAARGHEHVGCISSRLGTSPRNARANPGRVAGSRFTIPRDRVRGLERGLGRPVVVEERWHVTAAAGADAAAALLRHDPRITAIACVADSYALGVLAWAKAHHIQVPRHLAVTGFDDVPAAAGAGLTTVRQPFAEKGRTAATALNDAIDAGAPPRRFVLPTALVERASTGRTRR